MAPTPTIVNFTVPVADGVTIENTNGVLSVIPTSQPAPVGTFPPAGTTWDGTTFTVPKISTTELDITGGTTYPDGNYLTNFAEGLETYVPYVAPVIPPPTAPVVSPAYSVVLPATTGVASEMTASVTLKIAGITATANTVTCGPQVIPPGGNWDWVAFISAPGVVTVQVRNKTWAAVNFPATTFTVKVQ